MVIWNRTHGYPLGYTSGYPLGHGTPWDIGQEMTDRAAPLVQVCLDYGLTGVLPLNDVFWPNLGPLVDFLCFFGQTGDGIDAKF